MILGSGEYCYQVVKGWGQGADGRTLGIASGVAVDSQDKVYVVDREPNPAIVVYDRDGRFLSSWGEDLLSLPHDIFIDSADRLYIADCGDHTVRICTTEGQVLKTLGTPGKAGAPGEPFNMPTRAVLSPSGDIYVSDGYGQHQIHRFSPDGDTAKHLGQRGSSTRAVHPSSQCFYGQRRQGFWSLTENRIIASKFSTRTAVSSPSGQDASSPVGYILTRMIRFTLPRVAASASLTETESCLPAGMSWADRTMWPTVPTASG